MFAGREEGTRHADKIRHSLCPDRGHDARNGYSRGGVMTQVTYEIRTLRNTPVYRYDNEHRAKEELARAAKRIGTKLRLVKITQTEEEIKL